MPVLEGGPKLPPAQEKATVDTKPIHSFRSILYSYTSNLVKEVEVKLTDSKLVLSQKATLRLERGKTDTAEKIQF
jgi:hypothetical protein